MQLSTIDEADLIYDMEVPQLQQQLQQQYWRRHCLVSIMWAISTENT